MAQSTYRDRAQEVRNEAQTYLQALRQERESKAQTLREKLQTERNALAAQRLKLVPSEDEPVVAAGDKIAEPEPEEPTHNRPDDVTTSTSATFANDFPAGFAPDEEHEPPPATADPIDLPDAVASAPMSDEPSSQAQLVCSIMGHSDLASLPGVGGGMVWRLNQLGVRTVDDLSQQNAADLKARLGGVGSLVPVQAWIDQANATLSAN